MQENKEKAIYQEIKSNRLFSKLTKVNDVLKRMRYEETRELDDEKSRRLIGVKQTTFNRMTKILDEEDK